MTRLFGGAGPELTIDQPAYTPGAPTFVEHDASSITIALDENGNSAVVEYAIYCNELAKYAGTDGAFDEAAAVWQTAATWGAEIATTGFAAYTDYTFKAKARNEADEETAFSSDSAKMFLLPDLDEGATADNIELEVTGGNTKVLDTTADSPTVSGTVATYDDDGNVESYYGDISLTFTLQSYRSLTGNSILVEFSEDNASWSTATAGTGSCATTGLDASADGESYTFVWDSYTDAGASELDLAVYLRVTPYDSDGDAGEAVSTDAFGVNNRPAAITWERYYADGGDYEYDKDTTPTLRAVIPSPRGGGPQYPRITFYDADDGTTVELDLKSYDSVTGWKYETEPDVWVDLAAAGIASAYADGTNRMEITVPAGSALSVAEYLISGQMYEVRDRG